MCSYVTVHGIWICYLLISLFPGLNKIAILGAEESDIIAIRKCFQSRWPYPLTHDYEMMPVEGNPGGWFFKVWGELS